MGYEEVIEAKKEIYTFNPSGAASSGVLVEGNGLSAPVGSTAASTFLPRAFLASAWRINSEPVWLGREEKRRGRKSAISGTFEACP